MNTKARIALLLTLTALGSIADAKTLYVDSANGNDSVSYAANSQGSPWRTLGRATWGSANRASSLPAEAARAGDVVLVSGGPHVAPGTDIRYQPAFNPVNSGTAAAPIVFRAVGRVELRTDGVISPVIGALNADYIHWNGFVIDERYAPPRRDTGPIVIWSSTGTVIDGTEVIGVEQTYGDNHNGVRVEGSANTTIRNTRISGIRVTNSSTHNGAGIMIYQSQGVLIEHNEFINCGAGIFPKGHDYYDVTIRYNRISGSTKGIRTTDSHATLGRNRMYQNIIENTSDGGPGIQIAEDSNNWTVTNNTIVDAASGIYLRASTTVGNFQLGNNIVVSSANAVNAIEWMAAMPGSGRNLYHQVQGWAHAGATHASLSAWQAAAPSEATSIVADPLFVDPAAGNYRLRVGSPARTLGRDLLDLNGNGANGDTIPAGAYVTGNEVIGRTTGPADTSPTPMPPQDVTVQ